MGAHEVSGLSSSSSCKLSLIVLVLSEHVSSTSDSEGVNTGFPSVRLSSSEKSIGIPARSYKVWVEAAIFFCFLDKSVLGLLSFLSRLE